MNALCQLQPCHMVVWRVYAPISFLPKCLAISSCDMPPSSAIVSQPVTKLIRGDLQRAALLIKMTQFFKIDLIPVSPD